MNNAGCHRAHDIPKSGGGDHSKQNIYLTCSNCSQTMGDDLSVYEYKTVLYVKVLENIKANQGRDCSSTNI